MTSFTRNLATLCLVSLPSGAQEPRLRTEQKELNLPGVGPVTLTLGFLPVPEVRGNPNGRMIEIAFLRLPARSGGGTPLMYLAGGPGDAGVTEDPAALASYAPLLAVGDVILVDQRGTGRSRPNLSHRWTGAPPTDYFLSASAASAFAERVRREAAQHFAGQQVDLGGYNTNESADDINDLRVALGAERMNLMGFSYGTHLGLAIMRRHGRHVANSVLIGTEGPAHTYKLPSTSDLQFRKVALLAARDSAIASTIPDLNVLLQRVLQKLAAAPMVVTIGDPRTNAPMQVPVGPDGLRYILLRDIGDASDLPVFPRLLYSIDQGDPTLLTWFVRRRFLLGTQLMNVAMDMASGVSPARANLIAAEARSSAFGNVMNGVETASAVRVPDLGEEFRSPLATSIRTLFLSGTLDWNTPPFQAEELRFGFTDARHIIVRNAGHEQVLPHPEVRRAIVRFLQGEEVDGTRAEWPPLRFVPLTGYDRTRTHPSVPMP